VNRRAARRLAPIRLLIAALAFVTLTGHAADVVTASPPEPPPVTANEFLPEDRDLSDCVGLVEKPGCGSEERGGALLNVVFLLVMAGMAFIFWRIIIGVRKNRAELDRATAERSTTIDP
jgi:hypothetical protein